MGFPDWTLWGMGLSAAGALLALVLALLGQSPAVLKRSGLSRLRLDLRVRSFTAYALALLLLATGFFLAGVPLGSQGTDSTVATLQLPEATLVSSASEATIAEVFQETDMPPEPEQVATPATPETGAFSGPPTETITPTQQVQIEDQQTITPPVASPAEVDSPDFPRPIPEISPTNTRTPTATPTPTPTVTPTPTLTPTPISGKTGVVQSGGSRIWIRRSPDGHNLVLVTDNEIVIILTGHANKGGQLWQEVSTLQGVTGWLQVDLLDIAD